MEAMNRQTKRKCPTCGDEGCPDCRYDRAMEFFLNDVYGYKKEETEPAKTRDHAGVLPVSD
jgi:hypothetical protein